MNTTHLSEEELQQYAMNNTAIDAAHIANCPACSAQVMFYRKLLAGISTAPKPVFDFDVQLLVMKKIRPAWTWEPVIAVLTCLLVITGAIFLFNDYLKEVFKVASPFIIYIILIIVLGIGLAQGVEMINVHRRKMRLLEFN